MHRIVFIAFFPSSHYRLQTGMRGAYGKPVGTAARVGIGQVIMSVRVKPSNGKIAIEALRRSKFKFPGRQKVVLSNKWGFTKYDKALYAEWRQSGKLQADGVMAKYMPDHGRLASVPDDLVLPDPE
jgi:large subunit ribosomal protein L10e